MKRIFSCLGITWTLLVAFTATAGTLAGENNDTVFLGVISARGIELTYKRYNPLAEYFSTALGTEVKVVPLDHAKNLPYLRDGKVDFLLTNPTIAATIYDQIDVTLLANLNKDSGHQFGGVIFSRQDSEIRTVHDIVNKRVLAYKPEKSAGGYIFQRYHLLKKGIDTHSQLLWLRAAKTQDIIVEAVGGGHADVGFIRTGILEYMAQEGKIRIEDFHVIDEVKNSPFPQAHSTALYPEWYLIAGTNVNEKLRQKFTQAALAITTDMDVAKKSNINGFVSPLDLTPLVNVLKELRIPPFDTFSNHAKPEERH